MRTYPMGDPWRSVALGIPTLVVLAVVSGTAQAAQPALTTAKTAVASNCQQAQITLQVNGVGDPVTQRLPLDVMIVFDKSASMDDAGGNPVQPITDAKNAAKTLVNQLNSATDHAGLTTFSTTASLDRALTSTFSNVTSSIDAISVGGNTNIGGGVSVGQQEVAAHGRPAPTVHVMVVLTDGVANRTAGGTSCPTVPTTSNACTQDAVNQAATAKAAGTMVFTIGLNLNNLPAATATLARNTLTAMATSTSDYFEAPTSSQLAGIFSQIATVITNIAGSNVVVTDILPSGVQYVAGSATPAPASVAGQTLTWNLGILNTGSSSSMTFLVTLDPATPNQLVDVFPDSRINFNDYQGNPASVPFPETHVTTLLCPTATPTVTTTGTATASPPATFTETATATFTATATATTTTTATATATSTVTATMTASVTATDTATASPTATATFTSTTTLTPTPTATVTSTATATPPSTSTYTATNTPTQIDTATPTNTPEPYCGDGHVDPGEDCDDGNNVADDGCDPDCKPSAACARVYPGQSRFVGPCGPPTDPAYGDIQAAIDAASDGDIITVCPGTYTQPAIVTKQVKLLADSSGPVIVHASGTAFDVRRSGVHIEGFTIQSDSGSAVSATTICPLGQSSCTAPGFGSNLTITQNTIQNSPVGIGWQRRIDCAQITNNTMTGNAAHIQLLQQEGPPAIAVGITKNIITNGGQSAAAVTVSGLGASIAANTIQGSVNAGIVLASVPGSGATQVIENTIDQNAGDGITVKAGADGAQIHQNNITHNGVGLGNESSGLLDATLNWWASQSGPTVLMFTGTGDAIQNRSSGTTQFIEFLCKPFPQGFPSTLGVCGTETAEIRQVLPGRNPDLDPFAKFIIFESTADLDVGASNADGSQEVFVLNRRPKGEFAHGVCMGGLPSCDFFDIRHCATCSTAKDCPGDPNSNPLVLNGECVTIDQLSNSSAPVSNGKPRIDGRGDEAVYTSTVTLSDEPSEVWEWSRKTAALTQLANSAPPQLYDNPVPSLNGFYIVVESNGDLVPGQNTDGNTEIFRFSTKTATWQQVTHTPEGIQNRRPGTVDGQRIVFDSNGDLVPGENPEGNRELFMARIRGGGEVQITQITHTQTNARGDTVDNRSGSFDGRGIVAAFSSNGDLVPSNGNLVPGNADGNREVFTWNRRTGSMEQITDSVFPGENVNPVLNRTSRYVVFESTADLTNSGASNRRIFQYDRTKQELELLSKLRDGTNQAPRNGFRRYVVWESTANLTGNNPNKDSVIYLFDRRDD